MNDTNQTLLTLFDRYATLAAYCDQAFAAAADRYAAQMQCAKGCAACCRLETVVPLEAALIAAYLAVVPLDVDRADDDADALECAFLKADAACAIYPARPLICRTHGMPMQYPDQAERDACPLNFSAFSLDQIEPQYVLSTETVTTNLMRLNLALCMIAGDAEFAGERIRLSDLRDAPRPLPPFSSTAILSDAELTRRIVEAVTRRGAWPQRR